MRIICSLYCGVYCKQQSTVELHFQFLYYYNSLEGVGCPGQSLVGRCDYEIVVVSVVWKDFWDGIPDGEIWCWFGW